MADTSAKVRKAAEKLRELGVTHVTRRENGSPVIHIEVGGEPPPPDHNDMAASSAGQLKAFIERIERLEEEKRTIAGDIRDLYAEAKGNGFDAPILRKIVRIRAEDPQKRREQEELLDTYLHALGMV